MNGYLSLFTIPGKQSWQVVTILLSDQKTMLAQRQSTSEESGQKDFCGHGLGTLLAKLGDPERCHNQLNKTVLLYFVYSTLFNATQLYSNFST